MARRLATVYGGSGEGCARATMTMTVLRNAIIGCFATIGLFGNQAWSQTTKTIKLVVAAPPGGASDVLARVMAEHIGRLQAVTWGKSRYPSSFGFPTISFQSWVQYFARPKRLCTDYPPQ